MGLQAPFVFDESTFLFSGLAVRRKLWYTCRRVNTLRQLQLLKNEAILSKFRLECGRQIWAEREQETKGD